MWDRNIPPKIKSIAEEYDAHSRCNDKGKWPEDRDIDGPLQVQPPRVDGRAEAWAKESLKITNY